MPGERKDPYRGFLFRVEIDKVIQAGFRECTFGDVTTDSVEYREGTDPKTVRKLSGLTKFANITLKWGITDSTELHDWAKKVADTGAKDNRKSVAIILVDEAGAEAARWDITNAWPTKYDPPDFNATSTDVAVETLEIAHEGFVRVSV